MNTTFDAPADGGHPAGAPDPHSARFRTKRWYRWGIGAALAGFLVGGGITLAAVSGGGTAATGSASGAQAAALNSTLSAAAGVSGAAGLAPAVPALVTRDVHVLDPPPADPSPVENAFHNQIYLRVIR